MGVRYCPGGTGVNDRLSFRILPALAEVVQRVAVLLRAEVARWVGVELLAALTAFVDAGLACLDVAAIDLAVFGLQCRRLAVEAGVG